jgi:hypothetical protein
MWALKVKDLVGEVYGYPLNLLDPYFEDPTKRELDMALQEARRLIFDKGTCARLDPLPGPGAAATKLDICIMVSVLLKGEQNNNLSSVGSKQHATQTAPQIFLFPPSLDSHTCGIAPGEYAASV